MALSFSDLVGLAQGAGFSGNSANTAAAIAMAESSGNPDAVTIEPNGTTSYGLTQINSIHPGASDALDPSSAFDQMFSLSNGGTNFSPWTQYNNGNYQQYLPADGSTVSDNQGDSISTVPGGGGFLSQILGFGGLGGGLNDPSISGGTAPNMQSGGPSSPATDANGNPVSTSASPLSQIFGAIGDLFQRGGFILLGILLLGIGAYFVAKPKGQAIIAKAAKVVGE